MKRIAIIGGGAAAVMACGKLLDGLQDHCQEDVEILVYEKNENINGGLPYSQKEDCYILNLPISAMRADFKNESGFSEWLKMYSPAVSSDFPPRKYFGFYLAYLATELEKKSKQQRVQIKYITNTNIENIEQKDNSLYVITSHNREKWDVNCVMLCTGHLPNEKYKSLERYPNYRHSQWKEGGFDNIGSLDTVGVIGSRLSAIDAVMKLKESNHKGKIILFSRSGLLPAVLPKNVLPYTLKYLTLDNLERLTTDGLKPLSLDALLDLFWKEISDAQGYDVSLNTIKDSLSNYSALEWINKEIACAESELRPWQQVLFASYPIAPKIWQRLSSEGQKQFMENYYSLYLTYLAAFPLENAYHIQELLKTGQLSVVSDLENIDYKNDSFSVQSKGGIYQCQHLFNSIGSGFDPTASELYRKLDSNGMLSKHPIGGVEIDTKTFQVLDSNKTPQPGIYAVGEITRGVYLTISDMSQLMRQVNNAGTHLCDYVLENSHDELIELSSDVKKDAEIAKQSDSIQAFSSNPFSIFSGENASTTATVVAAAALAGATVGYFGASYMVSPSPG